MNTRRKANLTIVRGLLKRQESKGVNVTFDGEEIILIDPLGEQSSINIHSNPKRSGARHFEVLLRKSFEAYVMKVLAPGSHLTSRDHHAWQHGDYACGAFANITFQQDCRIGIAICDDPNQIEQSYLHQISGGGEICDFSDWPRPDEIRAVLAKAVANFELYKRFLAVLEKLEIVPVVMNGKITIDPVVVSFLEGLRIEIVLGGTPLLKESREKISLVENFLEQEKRHRDALDSATNPLGINDQVLDTCLDLV